MGLLLSGKNYYQECESLIQNGQNLLLISPYIKAPILEKLLSKKPQNARTTVITTWTPFDIQNGYSDLEVFNVTEKYKCTLLLNQRVHLKTLIEYPEKGIIGSANITSKGLGIVENHNYEAGAYAELELSDKLYFDQIIEEGLLVTQDVFASVTEQLDEMDQNSTPDDTFELDISIDNYLLSSLPMTSSVEHLYEVYKEQEQYSVRDQTCAEADLRRYKCSKYGLAYGDFIEQIKSAFFQHSFIQDLLAYNDTGLKRGTVGRQFGDLRIWIKDHTTTVPVPTSPDVNQPLNNVINWVVELSDQYDKFVPGHTTILRKVVSV